MPDLDPQLTVLPIDTEISGDAAQLGTANPVTLAEIKDIYADLRLSVQERRDALNTLRQEMVGRQAADLRSDTKELIAAIDEGLGYLSEDGDAFASHDVLRVKDAAVNPDNL